MPGAGDNLPVKLALPQRPAAMEAYIIDSKEFTAHIRYRNRLSVFPSN